MISAEWYDYFLQSKKKIVWSQGESWSIPNNWLILELKQFFIWSAAWNVTLAFFIDAIDKLFTKRKWTLKEKNKQRKQQQLNKKMWNKSLLQNSCIDVFKNRYYYYFFLTEVKISV